MHHPSNATCVQKVKDRQHGVTPGAILVADVGHGENHGENNS